MIASLPIRIRLTLAFAVAMALVLAATGLFVYLRLAAELDETLDNGLRSRAGDVAALVRRTDLGLREDGGTRLVEPDESFAQVLDRAGRVVDATPQLGERPLLAPAALARAKRRTITVDRAAAPGGDDPVRLLATPVVAQGRRLVVVVGASVEPRDEALAGLLGQLAIGGPVALVLASLLGYGLATSALRPIESMRRQASAISASEPGAKLSVPATRDEVARLGETLNDMLARLEAALARERSFVADASHELRTPLALLKTELELALRRPRPVEELERALRSAVVETDRLAQLAEDLLVLARADQGQLPLRRRPVRAADILGRVAERFAARAEQAKRELRVESADGLELVADALRLEQALGNLVENALRHGQGKIVLHAAEVDGRAELHVRDEGAGFPASFVPRAFERFSRADEARASGGTGLGLAIVDVIARAHGGEARAANVQGVADIWIAIPKND
ncbi:MAG: HAMP domain-containing protein [Actinobacteria bacterium]|nr:HAMP domain-containing protein [Actinomycetota bacterium]